MQAPLGLGDLPELLVEVLDQVGGVDHLSHLVGVLEIDCQPLPVVVPGSDDGRILLPSVLLQEI